jgi:hypothetical protein
VDRRARGARGSSGSMSRPGDRCRDAIRGRVCEGANGATTSTSERVDRRGPACEDAGPRPGVCRARGSPVYVLGDFCVVIFVRCAHCGWLPGVWLWAVFRGWGFLFFCSPFPFWLGARGHRFLAPPSSVLRLNPSVLYTERRRQSPVPFSGHYPVRSGDAALAVVVARRNLIV